VQDEGVDACAGLGLGKDDALGVGAAQRGGEALHDAAGDDRFVIEQFAGLGFGQEGEPSWLVADDAGGAGLAVDEGEFAEVFAGLDEAKGDFAPAGGEFDHAQAAFEQKPEIFARAALFHDPVASLEGGKAQVGGELAFAINAEALEQGDGFEDVHARECSKPVVRMEPVRPMGVGFPGPASSPSVLLPSGERGGGMGGAILWVEVEGLSFAGEEDAGLPGLEEAVPGVELVVAAGGVVVDEGGAARLGQACETGGGLPVAVAPALMAGGFAGVEMGVEDEQVGLVAEANEGLILIGDVFVVGGVDEVAGVMPYAVGEAAAGVVEGVGVDAHIEVRRVQGGAGLDVGDVQAGG